MHIIYHPVFLEHDTGDHPENRKRLEGFTDLPVSDIPDCSQYATLVHSIEHIEAVRKACELSQPLDVDTIVSPGSFHAAMMAIGATILASQQQDFALVRPPGHHAHPTKSAGFCLFNNIAIAAKKLVQEQKKVLIFDFDGHLGDGTESIFYSSKEVLYWSFHQGQAYPGGGRYEDIGEGEGKGYTINIPLPPKAGDDSVVLAFQKFLPIAKAFNPDVVAVSAGFDGYHNDPLLQLNYSASLYYQLGKMLKEQFSYIFATLEGGYDTENLSKCVYNFIDGINGEPQRFLEDATETAHITYEAFDTELETLSTALSPYWSK